MKTLSILALAELFGVTFVTIYAWKKGTPTKTAMPETATPAAVKKWAKENGIEMKYDDPKALLDFTPKKKKPGPKPRSTRMASRAKPAETAHASARKSQRDAKPRAH